jgi:LCP family protein required for cell wall assembly
MPDRPDPQDPPQYRKYRAAPRLLRRRDGDGDGPLDGLPAAGTPPRDPGERRTFGRPRRRGLPRLRPGRPGLWRVLRLAVLAVVAWVVLSGVVFLVSATVHQTGSADEVLGGGGLPPFGPTTVLVLGSDVRAAGSAEPGAETSGRGRSDTMMLMRVGGGQNARLSIPRDTIVDIPGAGRQKINAAYAIGGPELAVRTVEGFLGIEVDHLIEVNFENFPGLIDAMGGVQYTGGCVVSRINGGFRNGGYTLRLKRGSTHIDGRQALALARTRKNECNPREDDRTRARRQQKILSAMRSRILSPGAFVRLPWIGWRAPQAVRSDMGGLTLMGLFTALQLGGDAPTRVLRATPSGDGLAVDPAAKEAAVRRFVKG